MEIVGSIAIIILGIIVMVFWWKMVTDAIKHQEYGWAVFIVFFSLLGVFVYYLSRYKTRNPYEKNY